MRSFLFIVLETASRALHYNKAQYACSNKSKSMRVDAERYSAFPV